MTGTNDHARFSGVYRKTKGFLALWFLQGDVARFESKEEIDLGGKKLLRWKFFRLHADCHELRKQKNFSQNFNRSCKRNNINWLKGFGLKSVPTHSAAGNENYFKRFIEAPNFPPNQRKLIQSHEELQWGFVGSLGHRSVERMSQQLIKFFVL